MKDKRDRDFLIKIAKRQDTFDKRLKAIEKAKSPVASPVQEDMPASANVIHAEFTVSPEKNQEKIVIDVLQKTLIQVCKDFGIQRLYVDITAPSLEHPLTSN